MRINPLQRTQIAQEQARLDAIERELERRGNQPRTPATRVGTFDSDADVYNLTANGRPNGQGRSITNGGLAPGDPVEYIVGAGAIDAMPHQRQEQGEQQVFGDASPKVAIVTDHAVFRRSIFTPGTPGFFTPPVPPQIAFIYALRKSEDYLGNPIEFPVPPRENFLQAQKRYIRMVYLEPRCELFFDREQNTVEVNSAATAWNYQGIPQEILVYNEAPLPVRFQFAGSSDYRQEVICFTGKQGDQLPKFPRFFRTEGNTCRWDQEIKLEWKLVEQYQIDSGIPGYWTPGTSSGYTEDFTRVFSVLVDGTLTEVLRVSDEFNVQTFAAMDENGTVHLTFRWKENVRHFQVIGGAVVSVTSNTSWQAPIANLQVNATPPPLDKCVEQFVYTKGMNITGATNLYQVRTPTSSTITWQDLINPDGLNIQLIKQSIISENNTCTLGEPTTTEATVFVPRQELLGLSGGEVVAYVGAEF
jgi:hypothetical protein